MNDLLFENEKFVGIDYGQRRVEVGEYDGCIFKNCLLAEADLSNITFTECIFDSCDLSNAKINNSGLKDVKFSNCKLLGLDFGNCNDFLLSLDFKNCHLSFSSFYKLKLKATKFDGCNLQEVDFIQADLTNSTFKNCNLMRAVFENTVLEKVDFRTAINYSIDPEVNIISGAKFSSVGVVGLLNKYNIEVE